MTAADLEVLAFAAEHQVICADHVRRLLGITRAQARHRLGRLAGERLMRPTDAVDAYAITSRGLEAAGSRLPPPRARLHGHAHDVGIAWLWLVARAGAFGPLRSVISERQLRSHDRRAARSGPALGVRLGGFGPGGRERLHYPDLVLVTPEGRRIAVELELTGKSRVRRERILSGYAADPRVDAVLYLVENRRIGNPIASSASRLGISSLVHVQTVRLTRGQPRGASRGRVAPRRRGTEAVR
jgi:hypothetical protein